MKALVNDWHIWKVLLGLVTLVKLIPSELIWTPILPAQPDQVDLWTLSQTGCSCKDGSGGWGGGDCACCVPRAACPCGDKNPHRCAQCGLQHHCNNMCNMTIDGSLLSVSAGTLEGSLVSPADPGPPIFCWYSLRAPPGHRVEIQLHRLVHIGNIENGTSCRGGYVEVSDDDRRHAEDSNHREEDKELRWSKREGGGTNNHVDVHAPQWSSRRGRNTLRICGQDQRLHPPIVVFSDSGIATILYRVRDKRGSPRFIAYYNFPPITHPLTGNKQWGGSRIEYTDCDWHYQDIHCVSNNECHLTSPGFPGVHPPDIKCKYLFTMSSAATKGTLSFLSLDLNPERCATNYVAVYAGTSTSSPLISKLCGNNKTKINFHGPNVLLLFSSGPFVTPFQYNGFHASLLFNKKGKKQNLPTTRPPRRKRPNSNILSDPSGKQVGSKDDCLRVFWSNSSRSGQFDTSSYFFPPTGKSGRKKNGDKKLLKSPKTCRLRFIGILDEVIQVSFFKYTLGGEECKSKVTIVDGLSGNSKSNTIRIICGPVSREPKDANDRFLQPEFLISSSNILEVHLQFSKGSDMERQFLTGAYQFHSSRLEGTKKPDSVCDVMFYGAISPRQGKVSEPNSALLWNIEGGLTCSYFFVPGVNQSLELTLHSIGGIRGSGHCQTVCSPEGCHCQSGQGLTLDKIDHIFLIDGADKQIGCLCGDVASLTPLKVLSSSGIDVRYHVGHYVWSSPGFNFTLEYEFPKPKLCGNTIHNTPAGLLVPPSDSSIAPEIFIFTSCSWVIENANGTYLNLVIQPPSEGSCESWNLTVESRGRNGEDKTIGSVCGGTAKGNFHLLPSHSAALLHLHRGGRTIRDWLITWHTRRSGVDITDVGHFTPKPELSRTQHGHDSGNMFIIRSGNCSLNKYSLSFLIICFFSISFSLLAQHYIVGSGVDSLKIYRLDTS